MSTGLGYMPYPLWMDEVVEMMSPDQVKLLVRLLGKASPFPAEVVDRVTRRVLYLPPGCFASSQRDLARDFGCSRGLVRSTQGLLEKAGFLTQVPTQGQTIYVLNVFDHFDDVVAWLTHPTTQGATQPPPSTLYKTTRPKKGRTNGKKKKAPDKRQESFPFPGGTNPAATIAVCPFCFRACCLEGKDPCDRAGDAEPLQLTPEQAFGLGGG